MIDFIFYKSCFSTMIDFIVAFYNIIIEIVTRYVMLYYIILYDMCYNF